MPQPAHWVCAGVKFKEKEIFYLDTLGGDPGLFFDQIEAYLLAEAKEKVVSLNMCDVYFSASYMLFVYFIITGIVVV